MLPLATLLSIGFSVLTFSSEAKDCYLVNTLHYGCNKLSLTEKEISKCTEIRIGGVSFQQKSVMGKNETITRDTTAVRLSTDTEFPESTEAVSSNPTSTPNAETPSKSTEAAQNNTPTPVAMSTEETSFESTEAAPRDKTSTFVESDTSHESTVTDAETTPSVSTEDKSTQVTETDFTSRGSTETVCPPNMVHTDCVCLRTCPNPNVCDLQCHIHDICQCPDDFFMTGNNCVSKEECGCYVDDYVLPNGTLHVNHNCTRQCSCIDDQLICEDFQCSVDAECATQNGTGECVCHQGFSGNGETCVRFSDCYDALSAGYTEDGVYTMYPTNWPLGPFDVYCKMSEGGWTVFQRNGALSANFHRNWSDYKEGFGDIQDEFWLGNEKLYYLTKLKTYKLRVEITTENGVSLYAEYSDFVIDSETGKYKVKSLGDYSGDAGNGLLSSFMYSFSTFDVDNDGLSTGNCAEGHRGGWWYGGNFYTSSNSLCNAWIGGSNFYYSCGVTNLNGDPMGTNGETSFWGQNQGENCNLLYTEMKLVPSL